MKLPVLPPRPHPRHRGRLPSMHDPSELPRHRAEQPSVHDLAAELDESRETMARMQDDLETMRTERNVIPPPRHTSSPMARYWQKKWWTVSVWALALAAATTITVVVASAVESCQTAATRQFIELHKAP